MPKWLRALLMSLAVSSILAAVLVFLGFGGMAGVLVFILVFVVSFPAMYSG